MARRLVWMPVLPRVTVSAALNLRGSAGSAKARRVNADGWSDAAPAAQAVRWMNSRRFIRPPCGKQSRLGADYISIDVWEGVQVIRRLGFPSDSQETDRNMGVFLLGTVMVGPPFAPGIGILAEGGAGDGSQRSADQILSCGVQGIVVKQIKELGNGGETLLASEHARTSEISSGAFADALRGIVGQNGKKRVNRLDRKKHR